MKSFTSVDRIFLPIQISLKNALYFSGGKGLKLIAKYSALFCGRFEARRRGRWLYFVENYSALFYWAPTFGDSGGNQVDAC